VDQARKTVENEEAKVAMIMKKHHVILIVCFATVLLPWIAQSLAASNVDMNIGDARVKFDHEYLQQPNVVGTATSSSGALVLFLDKEPIGAFSMFPSFYMGHEVKIEVTGPFYATDDRAGKWRAVQGGISGGSFHGATGTLGCLVFGDNDNQPYMLSNNHVFAESSSVETQRASKGDNILQPGLLDGGNPNSDIIGYLERWGPLNETGANTVDCAIAKVNRADVTNKIMDVGVPTRIVSQTQVSNGMRVKKSGRTTGLTYGNVEYWNCTTKVGYDYFSAIFTNQIMIDNVQTGFGLPGDSGSLVLTEDNGVVGLMFASGYCGIRVVASPIELVMSELKVHFSFVDDGIPSILVNPTPGIPTEFWIEASTVDSKSAGLEGKIYADGIYVSTGTYLGFFTKSIDLTFGPILGYMTPSSIGVVAGPDPSNSRENPFKIEAVYLGGFAYQPENTTVYVIAFAFVLGVGVLVVRSRRKRRR
jgi:hypothetical protein